MYHFSPIRITLRNHRFIYFALFLGRLYATS
jgi:hypothetical protein